MLKNLKCECCGAPLRVSFHNTETYTCEYCGAKYEVKNENTPLQSVIRIETYRNPVRTLVSKMEISEEDLRAIGEEHYAEVAMKNLTSNLAESLAPMMNIEKTYDSMRMKHIISARVRVVEADYRF